MLVAVHKLRCLLGALLFLSGIALVAQGNLVSEASLSSLEWTAEEQAWIEAHPRLRVIVDRNLRPFDYVGPNGEHLGVSSSYLAQFSESTGIELEIVADAPWQNLIGQVERGSADLIACIVPTEARRARFRFSQPYASFPTVIVGRTSGEFINGLKSLSGRPVAVHGGTYTEDILRRDWPHLRLVSYETKELALEAVSSGEVDAYVGNLATAAHIIRRENLANLQVASPTIISRSELAFAAGAEGDILIGLLEKVLASIDDVSRNRIEQEWIAVRFQHVNLLLLGKWGAAALAVFAFALAWNFTQSAEIRRRKKAERTAREAVERFEQLGTNVPNGAVYQLALSPSGETRFRYLTGLCAEFFARPLKELYASSRGFIDIIDPTDRERYLEARNQSAKALTDLRIEFGVTNREGRRLALELCATPRREADGTVVWDGVAIDISEQRRVTQLIVRNAERLRLVLEAGRIGVWDWDAEGGTYTINLRQAELHGLPEDQLTPPLTDAARNVVEEDRKLMLQAVRKLTRGNSSEEVIEYRVRGAEGDIRWIFSHGRVIERDAAGRPRRAVGVSTDITARKRFEDSMLRAKELAEQMNFQKSEFLGMAAHDLKNPLASITGLAGLLEDQLKSDGVLRGDDPDTVEMLGDIRHSADHMLKLIHDLLNVERIESGAGGELQWSEGDVLEPLGLALDLNRPQAHNKKVSLEIEAPEDCPARFDRDRLTEVFDNLINNGVKYTPPESRLWIRLERLGEVGFRFSVRDSGPGFREGDFAFLFQKFKKLSARPTGGESSTGLGLSIVKTIVERHGGRIWAENHPEGGAVFFVEIPGAGARLGAPRR